MKTFHLKHMRSGLCIKPSDWYGSYHQWADLKLQTDCSSLGGVFLPTSQPSMQHAISSMCIYWSYGRAKISRCTYSRQQTQFKLVSGKPRFFCIIYLFHMRFHPLFHTEKLKKSPFLAFKMESDIMICSQKPLCTAICKELPSWYLKFSVK